MTDNAVILAKMAIRAKEAFHSGKRKVYIYNEPDDRPFELDCNGVDIKPLPGEHIDGRERYQWEQGCKKTVAAHVSSLIETAVEASEGHYLIAPMEDDYEPDDWNVKVLFTVACIIPDFGKTMWLSLWFGICLLDMEKVASALNGLE